MTGLPSSGFGYRLLFTKKNSSLQVNHIPDLINSPQNLSIEQLKVCSMIFAL